MSRHLIPVLGLLAATVAFPVLAATPVDLLSHRAAYRLSLADSDSSSSGLESLRGALVLEWRADCSGWLSQQRLGFVAQTSEGSDVSSDIRFTSWEAPDYTRFRFEMRSFDDGKPGDTVSGAAALAEHGGKGEARYTQPDGDRIDLPPGTLFPTEHVIRLIEAAEAGQRMADNYVFDGSDVAALHKVTAVIGQPKTVKRDDGAQERHWPVSLAYYDIKTADALPEFQIAFDLSEHGVLDKLILNYGEYALKGELEKLEPLPAPKCP